MIYDGIKGFGLDGFIKYEFLINDSVFK